MIFKLLKYINILSIDVVLGAISMTHFAASFFRFNPNLLHDFLLGAAVWVIYTADHLADSKKINGNDLSERHAFHLRHFKSLIIYVVIISGAGFFAALILLDKKIMEGGIYIAIFSVLYLVYSYFLKNYAIPKEILVALLYTIGVCFPFLIYMEQIEGYTLLFLSSIFLTAFSNLLLFSVFSYEEDLRASFKSLATKFGINGTVMAFMFVSLVNFACCVFSVLSFNGKGLYFIVLYALNFYLFIIFINKSFFKRMDRYRIAGDLAFTLPGLLILLK